ncbi:serine hydrolase domain-containing protein [Kangiella sp. M94]
MSGKTLVKAVVVLLLAVGMDAMASNTAENMTSKDKIAETIESNLLPIHYLKGHVTQKSIPQVMLQDKIAGVSIVFIDDGKIAWRKVYGYADLEEVEKVTAATVFTGASLSKPIAAITALQLVDQRQLDLDEDVNRKLESWKVPESGLTKLQKVTLRHLIGHTAGVMNLVGSSYSTEEKVPTVAQMLAGEAPSVDPAITMKTEPGERYKYSNPGYYIIEQLIQDVTDKSFEDAVEEGVLSPANMKDSSFVQPIPEYLKKRKAIGYSNELQPYPYKIFPWRAAGGIWTTPDDLAKFISALMNDYHEGSNVLVSREMAEQIFARTDNRLGFTKKYSDEGEDLIFDHWGSNAGFTSYMVGSLEDKQGLVVMTNSDNGFALMAAISRAVAQEYDWKLLKPKVYEPVSIDEDSLTRYMGKFGDGKEDGEVSQFSVKGGKFYLSSKGKNLDQELIPIASNKFILPSEYTTYEFIQGRDGSIKWVRVTHESGWNYDLIKY